MDAIENSEHKVPFSLPSLDDIQDAWVDHACQSDGSGVDGVEYHQLRFRQLIAHIKEEAARDAIRKLR